MTNFCLFSQSLQKNNEQIIKSTSTEIKKLNSIVKFSSHSSTSTRVHQLMLEKIVSEFHSIVGKYMQSEKNLTMKMKKTMLVALDSSDDEDMSQSQQQKQLLQSSVIEKELLVERQQEFERIEKDVIDINEIMNEMSTLISGKKK